MKFKVKLGNNDSNIVIPISGINNLLGYDDNIASIVNTETSTAINESSDLETRRFQVSVVSNILMTFFFWNGAAYSAQLAPLDFAANGLDKDSTEARNSFYMIQIFDTPNDTTQTKLHTGYFNGYDFNNKVSALNTNYAINNSTEFLSLYIGNDFLFDKPSTIDVYAKFFFYSAQSNKFYPFGKQTLTNQEDIYVKVTLNMNTYTYTFPSSSVSIYEIRNATYADSIKNTVETIPVEKPTYPTGNTFTSDGIYVDL